MLKLITHSTHSRFQVRRGCIDLIIQSSLDHQYQGSYTFQKLFITLRNAFSVSLRGPPGNQSLKQSRYGYRRLTLGSIPVNKQNQQVDL